MLLLTVASNANAEPYRWEIEEGTGNLIATAPDLDMGLRYNVEGIGKGEGCNVPMDSRIIRWEDGEGGDKICYFTLKTPLMYIFKGMRDWQWVAKRVKCENE